MEPSEGTTTIHVDEVASAVAKFYEKIRGIVDWREEHLLRRSAIERMLKRRILMGEETQLMADPLVAELIRGGHFPNDVIPEDKIPDVQRALNKYALIVNHASATTHETNLELQDWMLSLIACEIEEILSPPLKQLALTDYMTEQILKRIEPQNQIMDLSKENQIFIACEQALFKLDPPAISYHLLTRWYPEWKEVETENTRLQEITKNIFEIKNKIEGELSHPVAKRFYVLCEKYDTPYLLLGDVVEKDPPNAYDLLSDPVRVERAVKEAYAKRLTRSKSKVRRAAIFSTISIFITKVMLALLVEIPVDKYLTQSFDIRAMAINIAFPPLLMAALILSIKPPSAENLQRNILETGKIVYETNQKNPIALRLPRKRNAIVSLFIYLFYFISFVVSFGLVIKILSFLQFSVLSQIIFLMFISLISFAGLKIRQRSKELVIQEGKGAFWAGILDFFATPIVQTGKWLSGKLARYNIAIVLINALIEMPLQIFLEFFEHWMSFLKEKKEEIH